MDVDHNRGHLSVLRFGPPGVARPVRSRSRSPTSAARASPRPPPADAPITYAGQPAQRIVALARPVGALKDGDILTATRRCRWTRQSWCEATSTATSGWRPGCFSHPIPIPSTTPVAIGNEAGNNFTGRGARTVKTLERGVVPSSTTARLDQDYDQPMYVLLRLWTIGNSACAAFGNGIGADLDQSASFMHVVRYRPEANSRPGQLGLQQRRRLRAGRGSRRHRCGPCQRLLAAGQRPRSRRHSRGPVRGAG